MAPQPGAGILPEANRLRAQQRREARLREVVIHSERVARRSSRPLYATGSTLFDRFQKVASARGARPGPKIRRAVDHGVIVHPMKTATMVVLSLALAASASAQKSVPITGEPHHHLVFSNDHIRVFRVEVPKGTSTLLHEHPVDYFWIGIGAAEFENDVPGKPEAKVVAADGGVHFTKGNFAHIARNDGPSAFRNVTLELPRAQTNPRNLCATVLASEPLSCANATKRAAAEFSGAKAIPEFETDQTRVTLLTIEPDAVLTFRRQDLAPLLVAVDSAQGTVHTTCLDPAGAKTDGLQPKSADTFPVKATKTCVVHNATPMPVRFLAIEFTGS
jgi:hypothetical protein